VSGWTWLAIAAIGALGAVSRYLVDVIVTDRIPGVFPLGTLVVNVTGSLLLGFITGLALYRALGPTPKVLVGAAFCGAYTTFSTLTFETVALAEEGDRRTALANVGVSLTVGCLASAAGLWLAAR